MKKIILLFTLTIIGFTSWAQKVDNFTFEASYGISVPLGFVSSYTRENLNSTSHFDGGIRYMFNKNIGVKGELAYDQFGGKQSNYGMQTLLVDAQLYYSLGRLIGLLNATKEKVGMFAHAGFGVSSSKSLNDNGTDYAGTYIVGLSPLFKLSNDFALSADISYKLNRKQLMLFDGTYFPDFNITYRNSYHYSISLGVIYYLGTRHQLDWEVNKQTR